MSSLKRVQQWASFGRLWYLFDAKWQNPYESAKKIKLYLSGEKKPIFYPLNDCGDHVVVINSKEIALPGVEWEKRAYFHHTGYAKGASWTLAWEIHDKDPTMIMRLAVYHELRGNLLRHPRMARLHIFSDDKIPADILENISGQIQQLKGVPKRLDSYSDEEVARFPKIFDWPKDYIIK